MSGKHECKTPVFCAMVTHFCKEPETCAFGYFYTVERAEAEGHPIPEWANGLRKPEVISSADQDKA